jgi:hypothetical protein
LPNPRDFGPDRPLAGSLVEIRDRGRFNYIAPLTKCGLDSSVVWPIPTTMAFATIDTVDVESANRNEFSAWILNLTAVSRIASKVVVEYGAPGGEMVDFFNVRQAARNKLDEVLSRCGEYLDDPNIFWINEALKVTWFKLTFLNEVGDTVAADVEVGKMVRGDMERSARAARGGVVEIQAPVYVAFKQSSSTRLLKDWNIVRESELEAALQFQGDFIYKRGREPADTPETTNPQALLQLLGPRDAVIHLDGRRVGNPPLSRPVNLGWHTIEWRGRNNALLCTGQQNLTRDEEYCFTCDLSGVVIPCPPRG